MKSTQIKSNQINKPTILIGLYAEYSIKHDDIWKYRFKAEVQI